MLAGRNLRKLSKAAQRTAAVVGRTMSSQSQATAATGVEEKQKNDEEKRVSTKDPNAPITHADTGGINPSKREFLKRKVAFTIAYNGAGYRGLQFNPDTKTIEKELFDAMTKVGAISEANSLSPLKVKWERCARTDKGVSAGGNVISLKVEMIPNLVESINAELPKQMRVFDYTRVTKKFSPRHQCSSRRYLYMIPTAALQAAPNAAFDPLTGTPKRELPVLADLVTKDPEYQVPEGTPSNTSQANYSDSETHVFEEEAEGHRVDEATLTRLEEVLTAFQGTMSYHNFTTFRSMKDPRNHRIIQNWTVSKPYLRTSPVCVKCDHDAPIAAGKLTGDTELEESLRTTESCMSGATKVTGKGGSTDWRATLKTREDATASHKSALEAGAIGKDPTAAGISGSDVVEAVAGEAVSPCPSCQGERTLKSTEYVTCMVHGQSFILNQIRQMVGGVLAVMRGHITVDSLAAVLDRKRLIRCTIPVAPATNLLLFEPVFQYYNEKFGAMHGTLELSPAGLEKGTSEDVVYRDCDVARAKFLEESILAPIYAHDISSQEILKWCHYNLDPMGDLLEPRVVREKKRLSASLRAPQEPQVKRDTHAKSRKDRIKPFLTGKNSHHVDDSKSKAVPTTEGAAPAEKRTPDP